MFEQESPKTLRFRGEATCLRYFGSGDTPLTDVQMDRKNYNTYMFAQGNEGHEFSAVLTDDERRAIIEYLKTL